MGLAEERRRIRQELDRIFPTLLEWEDAPIPREKQILALQDTYGYRADQARWLLYMDLCMYCGRAINWSLQPEWTF